MPCHECAHAAVGGLPASDATLKRRCQLPPPVAPSSRCCLALARDGVVATPDSMYSLSQLGDVVVLLARKLPNGHGMLSSLQRQAAGMSN